jgi:hypothetical protein
MPFQAFPAGRSGYTERFERQQLLPSPTGIHRLSALVAAINTPVLSAGRPISLGAPRWAPAFG